MNKDKKILAASSIVCGCLIVLFGILFLNNVGFNAWKSDQTSIYLILMYACVAFNLVIVAWYDVLTKTIETFSLIPIFLAGVFGCVSRFGGGISTNADYLVGLIIVPLPLFLAALFSFPKRCPKCNTPVSNDSQQYCVECGSPMENDRCINPKCKKPEGKKSHLHCSVCGEELHAGIGGGDIKAFAALGFLLGTVYGMMGLFITLAAALVVNLFKMIKAKKSGEKALVSYALGPYIAFGGIITMILLVF